MDHYPTVETGTQPTPSGSAGTFPLVLSIIAVAVSIFALVLTLTDSPLGKGISSYDFSTPESALKSMMQIEADRAIQAKLDMEQIARGEILEEGFRTLEINKTVDFEDKKVIFYSYLKNGEKEKKIMGFEKNLESKMWFQKYVSTYSVEKINKQLAKEMRVWEGSEAEPIAAEAEDEDY